jgi:hypothetical protein
VLKGTPQVGGAPRANTKAKKWAADRYVSVQGHAWADERVCKDVWLAWRQTGHLAGNVVVLCDSFAPHRVWFELIKSRSHNFNAGEVHLGPPGLTHLWQPVDVGLAREFKCFFRNVTREYRAANPGRMALSDEETVDLAKKAWDLVTEESVRRYWVRSGYVRSSSPRTESEHRWRNPDDEVALTESDEDVDGVVFGGDEPKDATDTDTMSSDSDVESETDTSEVDEFELLEDLHSDEAEREELDDEEPAHQAVPVWQPLHPSLEKWLRDNSYEAYIENFQRHGVSNMAMFMMLTENSIQSDEMMLKLFGDNSYKWLCIRRELLPTYVPPKVPRAPRPPTAIRAKGVAHPRQKVARPPVVFPVKGVARPPAALQVKQIQRPPV